MRRWRKREVEKISVASGDGNQPPPQPVGTQPPGSGGKESRERWGGKRKREAVC